MTLQVDFPLKALIAAGNNAAKWLVVGVLSLVSDSEIESKLAYDISIALIILPLTGWTID